MPNDDDLTSPDLPEIDDREPLESNDEFLDPMIKLLRDYPTDWLRAKKPPKLTRQTAHNFLASRIIFYPGSGTDGLAIKVFGGSHNADCFVHADLETDAKTVWSELQADGHPVRGYVPDKGTHRIFTLDEFSRIFDSDRKHPFLPSKPRGLNALWVILKRQRGFGDQHGPKRIALLHVCAEPVSVFASLFLRHMRPPYAVLIRDHRRDVPPENRWGWGGLLHKMAKDHSALPLWLLVGMETQAWRDYNKISARGLLRAARVGSYRNRPGLYRRNI